MTYDELVTAVQDYCENVFSTVDMNTFIRQAEQRIFNVAQPANQRRNVTSQLIANNKYIAPPAGFLSVYSFAVISPTGEFLYLLDKDVNFMREAYPNPNVTGKPKHYAIFGPQTGDPQTLTLVVGPTPDLAYNIELHYFAYPESIVDSANGQTWLGNNFDSVLLYGTMCEALTYMKGEADMLKLYQDRYVQAVALYKNLADGKQRGDAYRDGQVRTQVA
jgi:hypothetical protein